MMFRSLRNRLILSHVLPLVIIIPLMGLGLVTLLERQFLLPQLAQNLTGDARLLGEISRSEYELFGNPLLFERMISRVQLDPNIKVMFLSSQGKLLYSSDLEDLPELGTVLDAPGLTQAQAGNEIALTNYSLFRLADVTLDVYVPVLNPLNQVIGIVHLNYQVATVYELFVRFRFLIGGILLLGLLLSMVIGSLLGINIGRPIQKVTKSIYDLASGERHEPLEETGPDELRQQAQAVNYLVDQLHDLEQSRRQLLANLVHELGRPLGSLRSGIQALSHGAEKDQELFHELTKGMDAETYRLQNLLEELANLYDQVLGNLELNRQEIDIKTWLPEMLQPWKTAAQEKDLGWSVEIPEELAHIQADPLRLSQVVGNLVSNAVKYTPSGGSISVSAGSEGQELFIKIQDTGVGIQPEEQDLVFTPFYRGDHGRRFKQGMGLGLSIARDLTVAHGGRVEMESQPGAGSIFTVWLPLKYP
jgi:two-component system sensor histidine kinase BaeS